MKKNEIVVLVISSIVIVFVVSAFIVEIISSRQAAPVVNPQPMKPHAPVSVNLSACLINQAMGPEGFEVCTCGGRTETTDGIKVCREVKP